MPISIDEAKRANTGPAGWSPARLIGPGLLVTATGIGAGDLIAATLGGVRYGLVLLWGIALGTLFKYLLNEGIARWQLATDQTALEGWATHLPRWVQGYFGLYLLLWTVAGRAALASATGLGINDLTSSAIPHS